jgi:hypothetical protein
MEAVNSAIASFSGNIIQGQTENIIPNVNPIKVKVSGGININFSFDKKE